MYLVQIPFFKLHKPFLKKVEIVIKATFKSHFKVKQSNSSCKTLEKHIFVKNIVIFLLFAKIFLPKCNTSILFSSKKSLNTSILKAPSRHKKFFHQVFLETFSIKIFLHFGILHSDNHKNICINKNCFYSVTFFKDLDALFSNVGSNILTRTKFSTSFNQHVNVLL